MLRVFRLFGPLSGGPEHRKIRNFAEASPKAASEEATSKESNLEEGNFEGKSLGYHVLVCSCCISVGRGRAQHRKIHSLEHAPLVPAGRRAVTQHSVLCSRRAAGRNTAQRAVFRREVGLTAARRLCFARFPSLTIYAMNCSWIYDLFKHPRV